MQAQRLWNTSFLIVLMVIQFGGQAILQVLQIHRQIQNWSSEVAYIAKMGRKLDPRSRLVVMCFSEVVYQVWIDGIWSSQAELTHSVQDAVRAILFRTACRSSEQQMLLL